jgi:signal transduction histidine kinase
MEIASGEVLWDALVGSVPFYVAVISPERRLVFLNRARGFLAHAEYAGRTVDDLDPKISDLLGPAVDRVLETGSRETLEVPAPLEEGVTAWIQLHLSRLASPTGPAIGVLAVGLDITESKQAAIELRMSVNALHRLIEARERLSHDMHDGILQAMYGVGLRLEAAKAASRAPGGDVLSHLDKAVAQLNDTMKEVRRFIAGRGEEAMPTTVRWEETLVGILRGLEVEGGPAIEVMVERAAADHVPAAFRSECLMIAREAVSNAIRHSGARRIMVRLFAEGPVTRLEVDDDGQGMVDKPGDTGLGILTMTHRASRIGATLTLQSTPQRGTLVRVDLGSPEAITR